MCSIRFPLMGSHVCRSVKNMYEENKSAVVPDLALNVPYFRFTIVEIFLNHLKRVINSTALYYDVQHSVSPFRLDIPEINFKTFETINKAMVLYSDVQHSVSPLRA